ncbi:RNase H domain-containing protein [Mycena kentingensis (nom. inval.)]|nr:RNase H domain-containing protein [Mycena kentingensis (nom. inval.)]
MEKGRFSRTFGPDLLPGMTSTPVIAVPKPHSDALRLISHQSCGSFAPNTMVDAAQTKGPRMDAMQQFIPALLRFRKTNPTARLVLWKSDVWEVFRQVPIHPLAQLKQVVTTNIPTKEEVAAGKDNGPLERNVDWCCTFGSRGLPMIWASVMGLVIWVAIFVKLLADVFCYVDDSYGWEYEHNFLYYTPYDAHMPAKQVKLLLLWDYLGIPHKRAKQLHGSSLPIIGFEIDPNAMTITLPPSSSRPHILCQRLYRHRVPAPHAPRISVTRRLDQLVVQHVFLTPTRVVQHVR